MDIRTSVSVDSSTKLLEINDESISAAADDTAAIKATFPEKVRSAAEAKYVHRIGRGSIYLILISNCSSFIKIRM